MLIAASVFIAAAGYIINDFMDIKIDLINKPDRVFIGKHVGKKTAFTWYISLNIIGLLIFFYLSVTLKKPSLIVINTMVVFALLFYSISIKKKFLTGNILISLLTAWVILIFPFIWEGISTYAASDLSIIWVASLLFGAFAFIISMIREVVKDMEDLDGDRANNCTTLPIESGISKAKVYAGAWIIILASAIIASALFMARVGKWIMLSYTVIFLLTPLIVSLFRLYISQKPDEFHKLSGLIKWIMFAGILSMLFL
jgi:4-hydroxybenzoate polyprenyltransferase